MKDHVRKKLMLAFGTFGWSYGTTSTLILVGHFDGLIVAVLSLSLLVAGALISRGLGRKYKDAYSMTNGYVGLDMFEALPAGFTFVGVVALFTCSVASYDELYFLAVAAAKTSVFVCAGLVGLLLDEVIQENPECRQ